jgi:hypothetical protein
MVITTKKVEKPKPKETKMVTVYIKEYDNDGELLFTFKKTWFGLADAAEYATEYHKGRLANPGGSYSLAFTRK